MIYLREAVPKHGATIRGILLSDGRDGLRQFDSLAADQSPSTRLLVLWVGCGQLQLLAVREHRLLRLTALAGHGSGECTTTGEDSLSNSRFVDLLRFCCSEPAKFLPSFYKVSTRFGVAISFMAYRIFLKDHYRIL